MNHLISIIAGLCVGSFANVCISRLPEDASVFYPSSHCPKCGSPIRPWQNIPLLSYIVLRGKCFHCQKHISLQYPAIEFLMTAFYLFHSWLYPMSLPHMIGLDIVAFYLITITVIDFRHRIIPDELSLSLLVLGWLTAYWNPFIEGTPWIKLLSSVGASLSGGLLMLFLAYAGEKAFKKEALGGGDVKLISASGAILGWMGVAGPLFLGSLSGGLIAVLLLLMKKKKMGETLPFGPFLSIGIYVTCLYPAWWTFLFN